MRLRSLSLLHKTFFALVLILLPVAITFFHGYIKNREQFKRQILDDLTVMAEAFEGQVYMFLELAKNRVQDFASDGEVKSRLKAYNSGHDVSAPLSAHLKKNKLPLSKNIKRITVISIDGKVVASTDSSRIGHNVSDRGYFINGRDKTSIEEIDSMGEPEISISTPVKDPDTGGTIGIMAVFTNLSDLTWLLSGNFNRDLGAITWSRGKHETMETYLVNKDRLMITESIFVKDAVLHQMVDTVPVDACLKEGKEVTDFYEDYRGVLVAGASMCLPVLKWTLLTEVDEYELMAPTKEIRSNALVVAVIVAGLVFLLFVFFLKSVILRLKILAGASGAIASGDYDVNVPTGGADEIGALSAAFNQMARDIKNRSILLKQSEERLRAIIDNSPAVIYMKDRDGRYILINHRFEELFKLGREDVVGKTDLEIFDRESAALFRANDLRVLKAGSPMEFDETIPQADALHYYISAKFPIVDYSGQPFAVCAISTEITERKNMEQAIRQSEERYRTLIANIPDITWTSTRDGKTVFVSPNIEDVLGYKPSEIYYDQEILPGGIHPEDIKMVNEGYGALFDKGKPYNVEYRFKRKDGQWVWIYDRSEFTYEKDGVRYADGVLSDITERKLVEQRIARLTRLYSVLSKINEAIVRIRDVGRLYKQACRIVVEDGKLVMAWIGLLNASGTEVIPVASYGDQYEYVKNAKITIRDVPLGRGPTGTAVREKTYCICNDIENDPCMALWKDSALASGFRSSASFPIRLGPEVIGAISLYAGEADFFSEEEIRLLEALAADVSFAIEAVEMERQGRLADNARREMQQRYEELVNNLTAGIFRKTLEGEGRFIEANSALVQMFEAGTKEELLKHDVAEFYHYRHKRRELDEKVLKHGFVKDEEVEMVALSGRLFWVSMTGVIKKAESGEMFFDGMMEDVTEKKKLEEQLRQSQKMEAVGHLAGGIAHDFNNILTALIGYGNLLLMKRGSDETVKSYTEHILTLSEKATNLTQGLLAFSRKQIINPEPSDVNDLVRKTGKILTRLIGEDIELKVSTFAEPLIVKVDSTQIEQVLMNLATNARDAMPSGGTLLLKSEYVRLDKEFEEAHGYGKPGHYCLITFEDTGSGMDEQTRERIFEPFFTTKEVGKGTGLGLSMVYGIIKQHEGYINVYSELGRGTTFKIYLPITAEQAPSAAYTKPVDISGGTETVLLAEDDDEVRTITRNMLEEFGYKVIEAVNGEDAVQKFQGSKTRIDLLVFDMIMPKKNGKEAYEEIIGRVPGIKVLFMSGYAAEMMKMKGMLEMELNFITKPVSPSEFLKKVREVIDR